MRQSTKKMCTFAKFRSPLLFVLLCFFALSGCRPVDPTIGPTISFEPMPSSFDRLCSPFPSLTQEERACDWGKELLIGNKFAHEFDLYRAITAYKRALVLIPPDRIERTLQLDYDVVRCYYVGQKYKEAVEAFEKSSLTNVSTNFPAIGDLLVMIYDSYTQTGQCRKAEKVMELIEKGSPPTAEALLLGEAVAEADFENLECSLSSSKYGCDLEEFLENYRLNQKSVTKAETLAAVLPGAGYWYVGQKKSAITSFIINTLFIAASYECFHHGYPAAGIIVASLEAGWYVGGINGSGLAAKEMNECLYQNSGKEYMVKNKLFPILLLETTF